MRSEKENTWVLTRRAFLAAATTTACVAAAAAPSTARVVPRKVSPNEKLNVAGIGVGGKGIHDIMSYKRENVVALCDVDWKRAEEAFYRLPEAKKYKDYRKMFDEMGDQIDMVTVATPDHTHAPAAWMAMKLGKHVYVEKPMAHTIAETRLLTRTARETGVATQMGNQGHSGNGVRDLAEMIWSGAIGPVREVHAWTDRPSGRWPQGLTTPPPEEPVPDGLDWDLWLGSGPERPYSSLIAPFKWRGWLDYGCGGLGDMGCHILDPVFFALKLGEAKTFTAAPVRAEDVNPLTYPKNAVVKYSFPARGDMPPVDIYWYEDGQQPPRPESIPPEQQLGDGKNGSLFVGESGFATAGEYGGEARLLPDERMKAYTRPEPTLERVPGANHYRNFLEACKGGKPAVSSFDYAGPLTEFVLLGTIALRAGRAVTYDVDKMEIVGDAKASRLIRGAYRSGWELPV